MLSHPSPATTPVLQHKFAATFPELAAPYVPETAPEPELIALNEPLALELGFNPSWLRSEEGMLFLLGQGAHGAVAQAYAGHQFGYLSPVLGDGRACLLGEVIDANGTQQDLHLKGSGRTKFARNGDGRAALGPMLREYLISNFLHTVGIPSTRSLAVLTTGHRVQRERVLPGAVLVRVASSHLRVGTFQFAALHYPQTNLLERLLNYSIALHYPESASDGLSFLEAVMDAQVRTVAGWMGLGFVHGVVNTDNTTISGQTIDFGPCAFLEQHDPHACFSSIDTQHRYKYGTQPGIMGWNLQRLAEALLPVIGDSKQMIDKIYQLFDAYPHKYTAAYRAVIEEKLEGAVPRNFHISGDHTAYFQEISPHNNPVIIPRNHLVEAALQQANDGNIEPFCALNAALTTPYDFPLQHPEFIHSAPEGFMSTFRTFCGT
ncbi:MAG: protein adenylyltransferase SelO family protein [Corynebacterium sp.]|nr:protein adenylyltransferase SelO family protein [Corynebacterium sp.]